MTHVLESEYLTTQDVALVPSLGVLPSRSLAKIGSPLWSAPMDTVTGFHMMETLLGLGQYAVLSRFITIDERREAVAEFAGHPQAFFAIGLGEDFETILEATDKPVNLAIDIAHGHCTAALELVEELVETGRVEKIMSGSICTARAARDYYEAGSFYLRVGVGPGKNCKTRTQTGFGVSNLSAVYRIWKEVPDAIIIADGGIRDPGDVAKYFAAGARGAMLGSVLAETLESSGWTAETQVFDEQGVAVFPPREVLVKSYRGQASASFQEEQFGTASACPEGVTSPPIQWSGTLTKDVVDRFLGGLSSAVSYSGLTSLCDFSPKTVEMVRITNAGWLEGLPKP